VLAASITFTRELAISLRSAVLAHASLVVLAACAERPDGADTTRAPVADASRPTQAALTRLADSAAVDSVALATLPPRQLADFDLGPLLSESAVRDTSVALCQPLSRPNEPEVRHRLKGRWPDQLAVVLFVRADRATAAIHRVELVRRTVDSTQRGYTWDRDGDRTQAIDWPKAGGAPETYDLPVGTPAPLALRALGRRLLALPCTGPTPGQP
jgi:hypothetical protein